MCKDGGLNEKLGVYTHTRSWKNKLNLLITLLILTKVSVWTARVNQILTVRDHELASTKFKQIRTDVTFITETTSKSVVGKWEFLIQRIEFKFLNKLCGRNVDSMKFRASVSIVTSAQ